MINDYQDKTVYSGVFALLLGGLMMAQYGSGTITVGAALGMFGGGAGFGAVLASAYLGSRPRTPPLPDELTE